MQPLGYNFYHKNKICTFIAVNNMTQELLLPILFVLLFSIIIGSNYFFTNNSISKKILLIGFSLKVISAILFGYFYKVGLLTGGDTYMYFNDGNIIYGTLKSDIFTYLKLSIGSNDFKPVPSYLLPYTDAMYFWFDSSNYFIVRLNAIIRLFSFGVYNVHAIVFAFLSFIGTYNIYLFFENKVISKKVLQFILFGIPSIVFWTSGIHKEAIVIFSLGIILQNLDKILNNTATRRNIFYTIFGLILLGYIRVYLLAFILPLMTAIILYYRIDNKIQSIKIFSFCALLFGIAILSIDKFFPNVSFFQEFIIRRNYFINSVGNMSFPVETIPHNFKGILLLIWEAISNPFIRPLPNECNGILSYLASLETILLLFITLLLIFSTNIKSLFNNPYAIFSILFGLSILFLIGLIVNNSGAIVRYRSIAIPFILIGLCLKRPQKKIVLISS